MTRVGRVRRGGTASPVFPLRPALWRIHRSRTGRAGPGRHPVGVARQRLAFRSGRVAPARDTPGQTRGSHLRRWRPARDLASLRQAGRHDARDRRPYSARKAVVIGSRAARSAGNSPPTRPMPSAHFSPLHNSSGDTLNWNTTWLKLLPRVDTL